LKQADIEQTKQKGLIIFFLSYVCY